MSEEDFAQQLPIKLGAVLTYATAGRAGVYGATLGANGTGEYAVLFMGNTTDAEIAARECLRRLERAGWMLKSATIVANEQLFGGKSVRVVTVPLPGMEAFNVADNRR